MNLAPVEIKAFVPARDFALSRDFYAALGFEIPWHDDALAYVRCRQTSFLLQAFDAPGLAANFQMHLLVEDVDAWYAHVRGSGVAQRFGVRLDAPQDQPWAMRDFVLFDPSGVLWRIAQNTPRRDQGPTDLPQLPGWAVTPVAPEDAAEWAAYAVRPEVMRFTSSSVRGVDDVLALIERTRSGDANAPIHFALRTPEGRLAGSVGFHTISSLNRTAEVTYDVHPDFWGRGLASAACRAAVRWGFAQRGWLRVQATTLEPHVASQRVLAKCGFVLEGRLRNFRLVRGTPRDYLLFARLPGDPDGDEPCPNPPSA